MEYYFKYFVLFLCAGYLDATKTGCDCTYDDEDGWFKYHEIPLTWKDAVLYCQLHDSILASPTTMKIKNIMMSDIINGRIFTGINSILSKGSYYSLDGIPLSNMLHTWALLQPDNKNDTESCISLDSDGNMSDVSCDEIEPFVCYKKKDNITNICGTLDQEYHHDTRTNKCYKFHTKPRDFHQANFACTIEGGHLAIINSEEESKVLSEIFAMYQPEKIDGDGWKGHAFIGFYYWNDKQKWTTLKGESITDAGFSKFAPGEPNSSGTEICGSVDRKGLLNDLRCGVNHAFICEKDIYLPSLCNKCSEHFSSHIYK